MTNEKHMGVSFKKEKGQMRKSKLGKFYFLKEKGNQQCQRECIFQGKIRCVDV